MSRIFKDAGQKVTIEICQMYHQIGFSCAWNDGKDLTLTDLEKEKEPTSPAAK